MQPKLFMPDMSFDFADTVDNKDIITVEPEMSSEEFFEEDVPEEDKPSEQPLETIYTIPAGQRGRKRKVNMHTLHLRLNRDFVAAWTRLLLLPNSPYKEKVDVLMMEANRLGPFSLHNMHYGKAVESNDEALVSVRLKVPQAFYDGMMNICERKGIKRQNFVYTILKRVVTPEAPVPELPKGPLD